MATIKAGQYVTDGTVTWIVDDIRDGERVGDIILRPTLRDGFIKANGATVKASEYPRLLAWVIDSNMTVTAEQYAQDCSKYVYDAGADTLVLPNVTGRVLMGGEQVKSIEAGLPNITGTFHIRETHPGATSGAIFVSQRRPYHITYHASGDGAHVDWTFDASKSNPIYGASETVQPAAISLIAQIKY